MENKNAAAFCRDAQSDELLRAQVQRIPEGESRLQQLADLGRRLGYTFTAKELSAAMGHEPVGTSALVNLDVSRDLSEAQLAAVSGAGWTMDEHWESAVAKPSPIGLPGSTNPLDP